MQLQGHAAQEQAAHAEPTTKAGAAQPAGAASQALAPPPNSQAIKGDPDAAAEPAGPQADLPAGAEAGGGDLGAVKLEAMQEDDDAFEAKPKRVKERGVLTSDVHSRTVESCKPVLAQASDILVGPEFDRATGSCTKRAACLLVVQTVRCLGDLERFRGYKLRFGV